VLDGPVLELARGQRAAPAQLAQDVAPETGVGLQELAHALAALERRARTIRIAPHRLTVHAVIRRRDDVDPVLVEGALAPQQPLQLGDPEPPSQAREQDQVLGAGDRRGRVHLDHPEAVDDILDGGGPRPGEQLPLDGEPPRGAAIENEGTRRHGQSLSGPLPIRNRRTMPGGSGSTRHCGPEPFHSRVFRGAAVG
jgi:hypothetical protein